MAIMGIIKSAADPANPERHVVLVGRGEGYTLIAAGEVQASRLELEEGLARFAKAAESLPDDVVPVRGLISHNVGKMEVRL